MNKLPTELFIAVGALGEKRVYMSAGRLLAALRVNYAFHPLDQTKVYRVPATWEDVTDRFILPEAE